MQSTFFEYCSSDVNRDDPSTLVVHRTRPSLPLLVIVLFPLPVLGMVLVRLQLSAGKTVFFSLALLALAAYCIQTYRSIRPRSWTFDKAKREVRIDGSLTYPFERLIRVELDQQRLWKGGEQYTRFVLTLCWIAGPERAFSSRLGLSLRALGMEIAECVGVALICTANGRELQTFEAGVGGAGFDPTRRY